MRLKLDFVPAEEIVFLAAAALGALQAADQQHGHAHRHQNGQNALIHNKPVLRCCILLTPIRASALNLALIQHLRLALAINWTEILR